MRNSEKSKEKPMPRFEKAMSGDIPELTRVMTRAFDDDSRRFRGIPEGGGPPGYNTGEFFRKWMREGICHKIPIKGTAIGAFIVFIEEDGNNVLGTIFIDPEYQDLGIGTQAIRFIEDTRKLEDGDLAHLNGLQATIISTRNVDTRRSEKNAT